MRLLPEEAIDVRPGTRGNATISSGAADAIAYGTLCLANADLVTRFRLDAPLNKADPATFYGGGEEGYTDYLFLDQD